MLGFLKRELSKSRQDLGQKLLTEDYSGNAEAVMGYERSMSAVMGA